MENRSRNPMGNRGLVSALCTNGIIIRITWWLSHDGRPPDHSWVALSPVSLDVLSTACRQRHRPCGTRRVSTSTAYPAFECILAVVPHPLVSISETAGGHEGRWECQPHNA